MAALTAAAAAEEEEAIFAAAAAVAYVAPNGKDTHDYANDLAGKTAGSTASTYSTTHHGEPWYVGKMDEEACTVAVAYGEPGDYLVRDATDGSGGLVIVVAGLVTGSTEPRGRSSTGTASSCTSSDGGHGVRYAGAGSASMQRPRPRAASAGGKGISSSSSNSYDTRAGGTASFPIALGPNSEYMFSGVPYKHVSDGLDRMHALGKAAHLKQNHQTKADRFKAKNKLVLDGHKGKWHASEDFDV
jgi:hypothetical protein